MSETPTWQDYFDYVSRVFKLASEQSVQARSFQIAGGRVCLRSPNSAFLASLTRALEHLREPGEGIASLTINCWCGAAASLIPPSPQRWFHRDDQESVLRRVQASLAGRSQAPLLGTDRIRCAVHPFPNRLMLFDESRSEAYLWQEQEAVAPHEQRLPLRELLAWWFVSRRTALVHAGAVGLNQGGVLLVGDSGAGKTSTALCCLRTPLQYAADDYCFVSVGSSARVHSAYSTLQVKRYKDLAQGPLPESVPGENCLENSGKTVLFLNELLPRKVSRGFPLKAVLMPCVVDAEDSSLAPVRPAHALAALAPSTVRQMPTMAGPTLPLVAEIVKRVPSFRLALGRDRSQIGPLVQDLLESLG